MKLYGPIDEGEKDILPSRMPRYLRVQEAKSLLVSVLPDIGSREIFDSSGGCRISRQQTPESILPKNVQGMYCHILLTLVFDHAPSHLPNVDVSHGCILVSGFP